MRIDRYVHEERLTWGATGVLLLVSALHAAGIGKLLLMPLDTQRNTAPPLFEVALRKLPPLPQSLERQPPVPSQASPDTVRQHPKLTRPVPILVDTPTTDPVPPDTQVNKYELGDESLPGEPGPPMPEGAVADEAGSGPPADTAPGMTKIRPLDVKPPVYPPRCLRMGIEGVVKVRVLVGEDGKAQEVTVSRTSGDAALDAAALDAVRMWRFQPAKRDGVALRAWAVVPIEFKLID